MRRHSQGPRRAALSELGSLLPLAMIGLLIANDHVFKFVFHNALTGKLSDVAICFIMPLLVSASLGLAARIDLRWRLWAGAVVTAIVFSALEMSDWAGGWFVRMVALVFGVKHTVLTRDPTDLLALACVPLAVAYGRWRARDARRDVDVDVGLRWPRVRGALALATGSLALMATTAPEQCGKWSAPTVFQVDGDCGTGGIIVVEADPYGALAVTNQAALLAPEPDGANLCREQRYRGTSCPYTLEQGDWDITIGDCSTPVVSPDAGAAPIDGGAPDASRLLDAGSSNTSSCQAGYRQCQATVETDGLWFTCHGADPGVALCRSRLAVLP